MATKQQAVRARILAEAERQFRLNGYSQTTMDHLAEELGMSKKTLYEHFRSKEKLGEAMLDDLSKRIASVHKDVVSTGKNAIEMLHLLDRGVEKSIMTLVRPQLMTDLKRNAPKLWEKFNSIRKQRVRAFWSSILSAGKEEGSIRNDINIELFANMLLASIESLADGDFLEEAGLTFTEVRRQMIDLFIRGLLTEQGRKIEAHFRT